LGCCQHSIVPSSLISVWMRTPDFGQRPHRRVRSGVAAARSAYLDEKRNEFDRGLVQKYFQA
jgi:hypothetical protein